MCILVILVYAVVSILISFRVRKKEETSPIPAILPIVNHEKVWNEVIFNVMEFGAVGDGYHDDTMAIQRALGAIRKYQNDTTMIQQPSSTYPTLYFPPSYTFVSAPFNLSSHMILRVEGMLCAISNSTEYWGDVWPKISPLPSYGSADDGGFYLQYQAFIFAKDVIDFKIVGNGTIDGMGQWWWDSFYRKPNSTILNAGRPNLIQLQNCSHVEFNQIELRNSPFWTLHPVYCHDMIIRNVRIRAPMYSPNVDGIDIDSCQNILVEGCDISCGDDHIAIKAGICGDGDPTSSSSSSSSWDVLKSDERSQATGRRSLVDGRKDPISCAQDPKFQNGDYMTRNVTIVSNTFGTGMGIALGSELSGGIQDIIIRDNRIGYGCWYGHDDPERSCGWGHALHLKTTLTRGGYLRNIQMLNNIVYNTTGIFYLETDYQDKDREIPPQDYAVTDVCEIVLTGTQALGVAQTMTFACSPYITCKEVTVMDTFIESSESTSNHSSTPEDFYHCEFVESYVSKRNHPPGLSMCFYRSMNRTAS